MEVRLFGPTTVVGTGGAVRPTAPKQRQVLALLALRPGKVVGVERIIEELWGPRPPRSAVTAVQTYVYQLRRLIGPFLATSSGRSALVTAGAGYALSVDAVDVLTFAKDVERARELRPSSADEAATLLTTTLDGVGGAPLADVRRGSSLEADAAWIDEQLIAAERLEIELRMQLGLYETAVAELRILVAEYPLVESFHIDLVESLYRVGRRSDAIAAYHALRIRLQDELGVEPVRRAQALYMQVISAGTDRRNPLRSARLTG